MTLIEIFAIIIIHWITDFIFQDEQWALGKSKNWDDLLMHTILYSLLWWVPVLIAIICLQPNLTDIGERMFKSLSFVIITFITHTVTDYFTSKIVSKKFTEGKYGSAIPNFGAFTIIGFDQVLHYIQLFSTYYLLFKI